jgi:hypothetical protein
MLPLLLLVLIAAPLAAAEGPVAKVQLLVNFEGEDLAQNWLLPRLSDWAIAAESGNRFLRLLTPGEIGQPRRPLQYAIRKNLCVSDFDLRVRLRQAKRSVMIAFGYQDTLHFYYTHLSSDSGDVAVHNGLFKVDGGERFRIAGQGSAPVLPDHNWHEVRIVRRVATGEMEVYADQDPRPRFRHVDASFRFGRIGLGSFDETGDFDDFRLEGAPSSACR